MTDYDPPTDPEADRWYPGGPRCPDCRRDVDECACVDEDVPGLEPSEVEHWTRADTRLAQREARKAARKGGR